MIHPFFYRHTFISAAFLLISFVRTRLFYPRFRLIYFPLWIRGGRYIVFGKDMTFGRFNRIDAFGNSAKQICFGDRIQMNDFCHIAAIESIFIGSETLIASRVFITDHHHGSYSGQQQSSPQLSPEIRPLSSSPVIIGSKVWIGENVTILPGVTIGSGCIIGAGSVVTKSFPANTIIVGNPAISIKRYSTQSATWEYL